MYRACGGVPSCATGGGATGQRTQGTFALGASSIAPALDTRIRSSRGAASMLHGTLQVRLQAVRGASPADKPERKVTSKVAYYPRTPI